MIHWVLIEAKSYLREVRKFCGAAGPSRHMILAAFNATIGHMGAQVNANNWLSPYYQFCNRLAFLHFLTANGVRAKLLFVYFLGDRRPRDREVCPVEAAGWLPTIEEMERHVGWTNDTNPLANDAHKLFLPVCPADPG